jgi:hypothetical protein
MIALGFDSETVLDALALGPDLLTDTRFALHHEHRRVAVAYHLLLDRKRRTEQDMNPINIKIPELEMDAAAKRRAARAGRQSAGTASPSGAVSPGGSSPPGPLALSGPGHPSPAALGNASPSAGLAAAMGLPTLTLTGLVAGGGGAAAASADAARPARRWFVGVWTTCDPATVMADVFRALKTLGFEWKILSPYKLKTRYPPQSVLDELPPAALASAASDSASAAASAAPPKLVKMGLQLYKTPRSRYVLDVQKLYGETFVFMNLCARLMTELRI